MTEELNNILSHMSRICGQESRRRNGVAIIVSKRVQSGVLGCNLNNDRMNSVCCQGKSFIIIVIQVYASTSNAKEAEQFLDDLQDLLELTPKKDVLFIYGHFKKVLKNIFEEYRCKYS